MDPEKVGLSRRDVMRAGATLPALAWAAPVVTVLRPVAALPGSVITEPTDKPTIVPRPPGEQPTADPTEPGPSPEPTEVRPSEPNPPGGRSPVPAPPTTRLPPGPGGLRELPATGLDAATLAAVGSASVAAGAAMLARNSRREDSAEDHVED